MSDCVALLVAAGRGERFGGSVPKQYQHLAGEPLLRRSLRPFLRHPSVTAIRVVIRNEDRAAYEQATTGLELLPPVVGGATRQESVRRGLASLREMAPHSVLIHDAARPFVGDALISRVLAALATHAGSVPALPVTDTLKRSAANERRVTATVDRHDLWRAQTPQGFRFADILAAHEQFAGCALTDDAAVAERAGQAVAVVDGDAENVKITAADDLAEAERRLAAKAETRIGFGFDVHRFGPGDHVMLGGLAVPCHAGLVGHSDADVVLHAMTDALFGSIGAGDIGQHFPPSDPKWRGVASEVFLRRAVEMVTAAGGSIVNVDITVICERPRIGPHRAAMIETIAAILGVAPTRVSVKATTTERLGFTGREEGIAAQAVASVALPR